MAKCLRKCEIFSRPCGYCRPFKKINGSGEQVNGYNPGKMAEVADRKMFNVNKALDKIKGGEGK